MQKASLRRYGIITRAPADLSAPSRGRQRPEGTVVEKAAEHGSCASAAERAVDVASGRAMLERLASRLLAGRSSLTIAAF
jgi:hypothetical protein